MKSIWPSAARNSPIKDEHHRAWAMLPAAGILDEQLQNISPYKYSTKANQADIKKLRKNSFDKD
jgi:hypothetical protein